MSEASVESVARAWALWVAESIAEDLDAEGIVEVDDERFREILVERLTDIAVSNAVHASSPRHGTDR